MRWLFGFVICSLFSVCLLAEPAYGSEASIYAPYNSFEEMRSAYVAAVESGDVAKQMELYELGLSTLHKEMEISKTAYAMEEVARANPDEQYWIAQFPKLFASGTWITRTNGVLSLSLDPLAIVRYGTQADATRGWNSLYTKFRNDYRWQNTRSMEEQYYCHYNRAKPKPQWNLEPSSTNIDPYTCNERP